MATLKDLISIHQSSLDFFRESLKQSKEARDYIYSRISKHTARVFLLGYAPRSGLLGYFADRDPSLVKIAKEVGVFKLKKTQIVQQLKNRIVIPIIHAGIVVGFGARALDPNDIPKYINSKSSLLYRKRELLYGLHQNRAAIQKEGEAYLVEGYFDVLGLADHEIHTAVASCGTSFTQEQAYLLKRYAKKVYVMFDGDAAGREAALKAKRVLRSEGIYAGRIQLPKGYDPDTFVKENKKRGIHKLGVKY
jgi:DNA primase